MTQQRLKAYLSLIQELLTCPGGEEWIRLRQHEDLVDPGLVQTMEQVATTLAQEGNLQEAKFLHNWAGQLHHILSQPDTVATTEEPPSKAYLEFIQALLAASPQEQQKLIAANQLLITPGLVHMMRQISAQLAAEGDLDTSRYLNRLATELGKLWLHHHQFDQAAQSPSMSSQPAEPSAGSLKQPSNKPFRPMAEDAVEAEDSDSALSDPSARVSADSNVPDPWLEQSSLSQEVAQPINTPEIPVGSKTQAAGVARTDASTLVLQRIDTHLAAIAVALTELNAHLTHPTSLTNPLWHLEALEQAHQSGWVLTTEEVERLIHVKPKCSGQESAFERGCWRFVKAGKMGSQTAWRVEKVNSSAPIANDE